MDASGRTFDLPDGPLPDQADFRTTWFVGFPKSGLQGEALAAQNALRKSVGLFWADAAAKVQATVQAKFKDNKLDPKNSIAVSSFRAKCFNHYVHNVATCIEVGSELTRKMDLHVNRVDFHTSILVAILQGISVPTAAFVQLEKVVESIGASIVSVGKENHNSQLTFWVSITTYRVDKDTKQVSTSIRTIFFQSDETVFNVVVAKSSLEKVDFVLEYQQYDATFNKDIFDPISGGLPEGLIEKMKKSMQQTILDVEV